MFDLLSNLKSVRVTQVRFKDFLTVPLLLLNLSIYFPTYNY